MSVFGEKNTYRGIPHTIRIIPIILIDTGVDPSRYIVIR
jgi:hypothetical protein